MASWLGVAVRVVTVLAGLSAVSADVSFTVLPQDTIGVSGYPVTIYCSISNQARYDVFWHVEAGGDPFTLGPNVNAHSSYPRFVFDRSTGDGAFALRIDNVRPEDAGKYTCLVYDSRETGSTILEAEAELTVRGTATQPETGYPKCQQDPNSGSPQLGPRMYTEGDILTLTCMTKGGIPLPKLVWERVTMRRGVQELKQMVAVSGDETTVTARVVLSSIDHESYYRCTQKHPASDDLICVTPFSGIGNLIDVRFAPVVKLSPSTVSLHVYHPEKVTLSCEAEANPPVTALPEIILPENKTGDFKLGAFDRSLVELELTTEDVGKDFYCRASNPIGVGEAALTINNLGLPTWMIMVIMGCIGAVLFILIAIVGCVLCTDRSYLARDDDKESQVSVDRADWMVDGPDGQADDDNIHMADFEGGQESMPAPDQKRVYENSDFETGEKRYQNIGYKVDDDEEENAGGSYEDAGPEQ